MTVPILFFKIFLIIFPSLISVAYFTLVERKIMESIQCRLNIASRESTGWAFFQFLINGVTFFMKKVTLSKSFHDSVFLFAPSFIFLIHFITGGSFFREPNFGGLFFFIVLALTLYGLFLAYWSTNFKSTFFQPSSYWFFFGVLLINVFLCVCCFNIGESLLIQNGPLIFLPPFLLPLIPQLKNHN